LICLLPLNQEANFSYQLVMLYCVATHNDLEVDRLPEIKNSKLKHLIKTNFTKSMTSLK
jgi:hypothetical protein